MQLHFAALGLINNDNDYHMSYSGVNKAQRQIQV